VGNWKAYPRSHSKPTLLRPRELHLTLHEQPNTININTTITNNKDIRLSKQLPCQKLQILLMTFSRPLEEMALYCQGMGICRTI
jgi:hypothetical protein